MNRVRPILFNTDMVRAILDGKKTVTRRLVKPQHLRVLNSPYHKEHPEVEDVTLLNKLCEPPYRPSDILYVRETWTKECGRYYYRADYDSDYLEPCETLSGGYPSECRYYPGCEGCMRTGRYIRWYPSIHMPKEAARIWLKVTDVRVDRLWDITNDQILKEGISEEAIKHYMAQMPEATEEWIRAAHVIPFSELWDSTIKKADLDCHGWEANPWVWAIEFERCNRPEGENI